MKIFICLVLFTLILTAGCASTIEPTAIPVNPNVQAVPQTKAAPSAVLPTPVGCQSKLSGKVMGANDALLKGAQVDLSGGTLKNPARTVTDDNGLYGFAGLCAGTYGFTVTPPGQPAKKLVTTATVDGTNSARADLTVK